MSTKTLALILIAALAIAVMVSKALPAEAGAATDEVERGRYLVNLGGCNDCHTPKKMTEEGPVLDVPRLMSGHPADEALPKVDGSMAKSPWVYLTPGMTAAVGPWGASYAANLTPDEQTGIGLWSEEVFIAAIRTGRHMGKGRPILPPMPLQNLQGVTDEDLAAIFAYLKSLPAVKNAVPAPQGWESMAH